MLAKLPVLKTVQASAEQELTEVQRLFRESAKVEKETKAAVTDAAHYIVLTFTTAERAEAYAAAKGWSVDRNFFVDGGKVAEADGISLPPIAKLVAGKAASMKKVERI